MGTLFNKTFFKFFFGFLGIIALGLLSVMFIGTLEFEEENQVRIDATVETSVE